MPDRRSGPAVRWGVGLALLVAVGCALARVVASVPHAIASPRPGWLAASIAGLFAAFMLSAEGWRRWLAGAGVRLGFGATFSIQFRANVAKYLPGGPWQVLGRVVLAGREGVPPLVVTLTVVLELLSQLAGGLVFWVVTAAASGLAPAGWAVPALLAIALAMHPRMLDLALSALARLTRRQLPRVPMGYPAVLGILLIYVADWGLIGGSFAALACAFSPATPGPGVLVQAAGAFAGAWAAGVAAVFAPAGLGVREAALAALLPFPPAFAAGLALLSRAWFVGVELLAFGLAFSLRRPAPRP